MGYHWCNQQEPGFYQDSWASDNCFTNVLDSRAFLNPILGLWVPSHFKFHWWLAGSGAYMAILVDDWQSVYPSFAVKSDLGLRLTPIIYRPKRLWLTPEIPESFTQVKPKSWSYLYNITLGVFSRAGKVMTRDPRPICLCSPQGQSPQLYAGRCVGRSPDGCSNHPGASFYTPPGNEKMSLHSQIS